MIIHQNCISNKIKCGVRCAAKPTVVIGALVLTIHMNLIENLKSNS